jgi:hypothetical protein
MFYVLIFSLLAAVLVVGGITGMTRRRRTLEADEANMNTGHTGHTGHMGHSYNGDARRHTRSAKRAQSRHDRRKRH